MRTVQDFKLQVCNEKRTVSRCRNRYWVNIMSNYLLEVKNLKTTFFDYDGKTEAVKGVSFGVEKNKIIGIVGESGSGKSVTAYSVMQILSGSGIIESGEILYNGEDILKWDEVKLNSFRGSKCAMVFQDPMTALNPVHTIGKQVMEAVLLHQQVSREEAKEKALEMLKLVGIENVENKFKRYPHELSGGQRQRVVIAMALVCNPDILIADEPTTALDVTIQAQILKLMKDLQSRLHMAIILVTHDLGVVSQMCDEVIVMKEGLICENGSTKELFSNPKNEYTIKLLEAVPRLDTEIEVRDLSDKEVLLKVDNLCKYFKEGKEIKKVVDGVSFEIRKGEVLGLVGESGCGKTTTSRAIIGLVEATSGNIYFKGKDITTMKGKKFPKEYRQSIQMIFQDPMASLDPKMKIKDIIAEGLIIQGIKDKNLIREKVSKTLELVGLTPDMAERYPSDFSGGQRQRVGIARAIIMEPELIIADEPVSALDVSIQAQILELLESLKGKVGLTILFISHDLSVVRLLSDRIAVMNEGKIVEMAETKAVFDNPKEEYTKKLLSAIPKIEIN